MSKGLRALKRIKEFMELNAKHWKQDVGYIEKELKEYEQLKVLYNNVVKERDELLTYKDQFKELESDYESVSKKYANFDYIREHWLKFGKLLEIIEKKEINMTAIKILDTVEKYNNFLLTVFTKKSAKPRRLIEEEFKLIKEWLCNEKSKD